MANVEIYFGWFFLLLGLVSLWGYLTGNKMIFSKRDYYIRRWGQKFGKILHFVSYVIVPIAIGIYLIFFSI